MSLSPGATLGPYTIRAQLGHGGSEHVDRPAGGVRGKRPQRVHVRTDSAVLGPVPPLLSSKS